MTVTYRIPVEQDTADAVEAAIRAKLAEEGLDDHNAEITVKSVGPTTAEVRIAPKSEVITLNIVKASEDS